jgi:hypothetical protein
MVASSSSSSFDTKNNTTSNANTNTNTNTTTTTSTNATSSNNQLNNNNNNNSILNKKESSVPLALPHPIARYESILDSSESLSESSIYIVDGSGDGDGDGVGRGDHQRQDREDENHREADGLDDDHIEDDEDDLEEDEEDEDDDDFYYREYEQHFINSSDSNQHNQNQQQEQERTPLLSLSMSNLTPTLQSDNHNQYHNYRHTGPLEPFETDPDFDSHSDMDHSENEETQRLLDHHQQEQSEIGESDTREARNRRRRERRERRARWRQRNLGRLVDHHEGWGHNHHTVNTTENETQSNSSLKLFLSLLQPVWVHAFILCLLIFIPTLWYILSATLTMPRSIVGIDYSPEASFSGYAAWEHVVAISKEPHTYNSDANLVVRNVRVVYLVKTLSFSFML